MACLPVSAPYIHVKRENERLAVCGVIPGNNYVTEDIYANAVDRTRYCKYCMQIAGASPGFRLVQKDNKE